MQPDIEVILNAPSICKVTRTAGTLTLVIEQELADESLEPVQQFPGPNWGLTNQDCEHNAK